MNFQCQIPDKTKIALRSLVSILIGGATGTALTYFQAQSDWTKIDFHKVAQTAAYGAITALLFHWQKKPTTP